MSLATLADAMPTPLGPPPMIMFTPVSKKPRKPRKPRPPRVTKEPSLPGDVPAKESRGQKVSFYLKPEVIRRLKIAATGLESDMSKVVQDILEASPGLNSWVLYNRAKPDDQATEVVSAG